MKNKLYGPFLVSMLALIIAMPTMSVASEQTPFPPQVKKMVYAALRGLDTISMDNFHKIVDNPPQDIMIVDVREPQEYQTGHVPGAINIPRGVIEFKIWKHLGYPDNTDYNKKLYLYCKTGGRCTLAARSLRSLGLTNITVVAMKLADWQNAGYPLVK
jgi:rhodanese-related sulfurtransferase